MEHLNGGKRRFIWIPGPPAFCQSGHRMSDTPFATLIWLVPAQPSHTRLSSLIADLARRYDAPAFEPHLTLGRVSSPALPELRVPTGSITLKSIGTFSSQVFTKTLFVRFAPDRALQALRSSLKMRAEKYDPHLSLLYCKLPPAELTSCADRFRSGWIESDSIASRSSAARIQPPPKKMSRLGNT